jgi:hypothetical protein
LFFSALGGRFRDSTHQDSPVPPSVLPATVRSIGRDPREGHYSYGDEVKFGGGKVIRDGMGQCQRQADEVVDLVITNALILDHWGIVKADIGIKNGRIAASARPAIRTPRPGSTSHRPRHRGHRRRGP